MACMDPLALSASLCGIGLFGCFPDPVADVADAEDSDSASHEDLAETNATDDTAGTIDTTTEPDTEVIAETCPGAACEIGGRCYDRGDPNPDNRCLTCVSGSAWTSLSGPPCDDGDACTENDSCASGQCAPGRVRSDIGYDWISPLRGNLPGPGTRLIVDGDGIYYDAGLLGVAAIKRRGHPTLWSTSAGPWLIDVDRGGDALLGSTCDGLVSVAGSAVVFPSAPGERTACVFKVSQGGAVSSAFRSAAPALQRDSQGNLFGYTTTQVVKMTSGGDVLWSVDYDGSILSLAADDTGVAIYLRANDDVSFRSQGKQLTLEGPGINAVARLAPDGSLLWLEPVYRSVDLDFRDLDAGRIRMLSTGHVTVGGHMHVRHASFGTGPTAREYFASGLYSLDRPEVGSAGDGFLAMLDQDGHLAWVRVIVPLHKYGSAIVSLESDDDGVLFSASYAERALLEDGLGGVIVSNVIGEADPYLGRMGSVIGRFDLSGTLSWKLDHHGSANGIGRDRDSRAIIVTLQHCEGPAGFTLTLPSAAECREVILSLNTNSGFECALKTSTSADQ